MTTKPDFKFGDRVIHIGERQEAGCCEPRLSVRRGLVVSI